MPPVMDRKGRPWTIRTRYNARFGWKWEAKWECYGHGSRVGTWFPTKEDALHDATLSIKAPRDIIAEFPKSLRPQWEQSDEDQVS